MTTTKVFMSGNSQAVRLPKAFRFEGSRVRISRVGRGILLEPVADDDPWAPMFDAVGMFSADFMATGREQPAMPDDDIEL